MRFKDDERVGGWKQIGSTRFQGYEISQIKGEFYLWIRGEERAKAGVSARRRAGFAESFGGGKEKRVDVQPGKLRLDKTCSHFIQSQNILSWNGSIRIIDFLGVL